MQSENYAQSSRKGRLDPLVEVKIVLNGNVKSVNFALDKLENRGLKFVPVDKAIATKGAEIKATYGLKLPDALIAGTAILRDARVLVSRDKKMYAAMVGLRVATPEELGYRAQDG